jgi:hypothetical protein
VDDVLDVKKALLKSFHGSFRGLLGQNFTYLGLKSRSLLRNLVEIRRLLWLLFNQDCVTFFVCLNDLRFNPLEDHNFSLFTYCDEETSKIIDRLYKLAKERIFSLSLVALQSEDSSDTLESKYGKLAGRYAESWAWFKEKAHKNIENLDQYQRNYSMRLNLEPQLKMEAIPRILKEAEEQA